MVTYTCVRVCVCVCVFVLTETSALWVREQTIYHSQQEEQPERHLAFFPHRVTRWRQDVPLHRRQALHHRKGSLKLGDT